MRIIRVIFILTSGAFRALATAAGTEGISLTRTHKEVAACVWNPISNIFFIVATSKLDFSSPPILLNHSQNSVAIYGIILMQQYNCYVSIYELKGFLVHSSRKFFLKKLFGSDQEHLQIYLFIFLFYHQKRQSNKTKVI